jgi:uncharacterized membrane protein
MLRLAGWHSAPSVLFIRVSPDGTSALQRVQEVMKTEVEPSSIAVEGNKGIKVVKACTVRKPAAELYAFWRHLPNLSRVIKHPVAITRVSPTESHWAVSAPGKDPVEWNAIIINDEPDRLIAWQSKPDADVPNAGSVRFDPAPGNEGTEVTVKLEYLPPGGKLGSLVAKLTRDDADQQVADALHRFKVLMEAGEIP